MAGIVSIDATGLNTRRSDPAYREHALQASKPTQHIDIHPRPDPEDAFSQCRDDMAAGYPRMSGDARRYPSSNFGRNENRPPMNHVLCRNGPQCRKFQDGTLLQRLTLRLHAYQRQALAITTMISAQYPLTDLTCELLQYVLSNARAECFAAQRLRSMSIRLPSHPTSPRRRRTRSRRGLGSRPRPLPPLRLHQEALVCACNSQQGGQTSDP